MMRRSYVVAALAAVLGAASVTVALRSAPALSRDDAPGQVADPAAAEAIAHAAYQAHLAANNAAAERWKSAHPTDAIGRSTDEELIASNFGCPEGTQFWQRDLLTELCATPCTSDVDCAPAEGRCRVIDVYDEAKVPAAPLVDDTAPEEIEALLSDQSRAAPPMLLCDAFWDLVDVPDLELFVVVSEAVE